jgi:hypothetical protein
MKKQELGFWKLFSIYLLSVGLLALSGCQSLQQQRFSLLPRSSSTLKVAAQQQWQFVRDNERYALQVIVERSADQWQYIVMNNLGQRIATVSSENGIIVIEKQQSHPAISIISELLEALQWSYWPIDDLQKNSQQSWRFEQTAHHREVFFSGILFSTIEYANTDGVDAADPWRSNLYYENKKSRFTLTIQSQLLN